VQAAAHAAEAIVMREAIDWRRVKGIELRTFDAAVRYPGCDDPGPIDTLLAARMSLQYAVASVLARGEVAEANFTDFQDPAIRMLVPKVRLTTADEFTAPYPARQGAHVTVRTTDGRVLEGRVDEVPSFDRDGIVARYRRVGADVLPQAQVQELERMSLGCAALADVRALTALLPAATAAAPRVRSATLQ
jgi:2-methylcitrate dehydratase PrpD